MSEFNKFAYHIPWPTLKEHLEQLKEHWLSVAMEGEGPERDKASGRVLMLMELLNLPNTLDIIEGGDNDDGETQDESESGEA